MTEALHKTVKTSGWRFRKLNGETVYSIDYSNSALCESIGKQSPTNSETADFIVEDFCLKMQAVKTPIVEWVTDNSTMNLHFQTFMVECDKLKHEPDKNSVRSMRMPAACKIRIFGSPDNFAELNFVVLVLRQNLCDARSGESFKEYTVLGFLPWCNTSQVTTCENKMFVDSDLIALNTNIAASTPQVRQTLRDCYFSKFALLPFGDEDLSQKDSVPTTEQLISFCIRWHVARKAKVGSFFENVVGSATQTTNKELDEQLFGLTTKYYRDISASAQLFCNRKFFASIVVLWNKNVIPSHHRTWMLRQYADAVEYLVEKHVIQIGEAARVSFVKYAVKSALSYFMPHVSVAWRDRHYLVVDFFSLAKSALNINFYELASKSEQNLCDGEQPMKIEGGRFYIPTSSACRLFAAIFRAAMTKMQNQESLATQLERDEEWLVDDTVMPIRNTDLYLARRTVRYDDFPVDGFVFRKANSSVSSTSQRMHVDDSQRESLALVNLPAEFGLIDTNVDDDNLPIDNNSTIPLRNSTAVVRVSRSSINDVCSMSVPDIEDLGNNLQQNACFNLHRNNAIPLCARAKTSVYVNTSDDYLLYDDRFFLYRFFVSLDLPSVTHESIVEFMLKNSTDASLKKNHATELNRMPKGSKKWKKKILVERNQSSNDIDNIDDDGDDIGAAKICLLGTCATVAKRSHCPYRNLASGTDNAEQEFVSLLKKISHPLQNNEEAQKRIIETTKRTKNIKAGCMQEFVETRALSANSSANPKAHPDLIFERPKHYVLAAAEHLTRNT